MTSDNNSFDVFLSYSTAPDYRLARKLEVFLERFHRSRTAKTAQLEQLDACLDGSDFVITSKRGATRTGEERQATATIPEIVESNLARSRQLLVLCSPQSMRSPWVRQEIRWFLDNRGPGAIRLALTRNPVENEPGDDFFAPEILEARLHESVWYDLRGFYRDQRRLPKLRDLDSERLRIVADLHQRSASSIQPLWLREQRRKARVRYAAITAALSLTTVLGSIAYVQSTVAEAEHARAETEKSLKESEHARAETEKSLKDQEKSMKEQETSLKQVGHAYRYRFSYPFNAAAEAYRAQLVRPSEQAATAMSAVHEVLVERLRIAREEGNMVRRGGFSFVAQASSGLRFTRLSQDGRRVLIMTERSEDDPYSPDARGEVHVLDNRTLNLTHLAGCDDKAKTYRLEFADFVGKDKILLARAFRIELYSIDGACVLDRGFHLQATKTPITAAGGLLHGVFFIAGNGAGCVWVHEYGGEEGVRPARELGVVSNCDDDRNPDAVLRILVDPSQRVALNLFQSGRLDLFAMDGANGRPKRRPLVEHGVRSVAFRPTPKSISFAVASAASESQPPSVERWDLVDGEPERIGALATEGDLAPIELMGFSELGELLITVDQLCALRIWDFQTKEQLFHRPADGISCPPPKEASLPKVSAPPAISQSTPERPKVGKPHPKTRKPPVRRQRGPKRDKTLNLEYFRPQTHVLRARSTLRRMKPGEILLLIVPEPKTAKPLEAMLAQEEHRVINRWTGKTDHNRRFLLIERGSSASAEAPVQD